MLQVFTIFIALILSFLNNEVDKPKVKILKSEFIYETAPFPSCHASTLIETDRGILASWFGGSYERHPDVSLGMRVRNENLIFGTIEVKGTYIPNDDEGKSKFAFSFRKNLQFRKTDVFVTAPSLIIYN